MSAVEQEELRRYVSPAFVEQFDREFYEEFGRWPEGSPLTGTHPVSSQRRAKIQALADQSPFEGERAAARRMLAHMEAASHSETDRMQRGGNWIEA